MTLAERVDALRAAPLFAGLGRRSLERIARATSELEVPAGQLLIERGAKGCGMFVILDGRVTVEAPRKRRELGAGDVVGEIALLAPDGTRTARAQAKTDVRCLAIDRKEFRRMLVQEPRLAIAILEVVASRLEEPA